jgi:hypothetical protein
MKPALPELQAAFAAHVTGVDRSDLVGAVVGDSIPAAARLRVYRHHVFDSLATALGATFATVQALVGEAFFRRLARDFVAAHLPTQPVLSEYGEDFADFIAGHEAASRLPYLADVARLDWALNAAFHAPFERRLSATELAGLPAERLAALPLRVAAGTAIVRSAWPIDRVWEASQPGSSLERVDLDAGSARLLVLRRSDDAGFVAVSEGEAAFLDELALSGILDRAAEAGSAAVPEFDLSASFARLLGIGVFAALQH